MPPVREAVRAWRCCVGMRDASRDACRRAPGFSADAIFSVAFAPLRACDRSKGSYVLHSASSKWGGDATGIAPCKLPVRNKMGAHRIEVFRARLWGGTLPTDSVYFVGLAPSGPGDRPGRGHYGGGGADPPVGRSCIRTEREEPYRERRRTEREEPYRERNRTGGQGAGPFLLRKAVAER